jgi:hypothetical protein
VTASGAVANYNGSVVRPIPSLVVSIFGYATQLHPARPHMAGGAPAVSSHEKFYRVDPAVLEAGPVAYGDTLGNGSTGTEMDGAGNTGTEILGGGKGGKTVEGRELPAEAPITLGGAMPEAAGEDAAAFAPNAGSEGIGCCADGVAPGVLPNWKDGVVVVLFVLALVPDSENWDPDCDRQVWYFGDPKQFTWYGAPPPVSRHVLTPVLPKQVDWAEAFAWRSTAASSARRKRIMRVEVTVSRQRIGAAAARPAVMPMSRSRSIRL